MGTHYRPIVDTRHAKPAQRVAVRFGVGLDSRWLGALPVGAAVEAVAVALTGDSASSATRVLVVPSDPALAEGWGCPAGMP